MPRSAESQDFHRQLVQKASERLGQRGYDPIQHAAVEGAGRPDLIGRAKDGKFEVIVECFVKHPLRVQLHELRRKYQKRKLVVVIPYGMKFGKDSRRLVDELWEFPVTSKGKAVLPVETIEVEPSLLEELQSSKQEVAGARARDSMMGSHDLITRLFVESLANRKKEPNQ